MWGSLGGRLYCGVNYFLAGRWRVQSWRRLGFIWKLISVHGEREKGRKRNVFAYYSSLNVLGRDRLWLNSIKYRRALLMWIGWCDNWARIMIRKWRTLRFVSVMTNMWNMLRFGCGGVVETKVVDLQGPDINDVLCPLMLAREKVEDDGICCVTK